MLRLLAGRNRTLGGALLREVGAALQTARTPCAWWCPNS